MPEPRTKTVNFERDHVCVEYTTNHGAPIFHATTRDYKSDLLIKVININDELVGCIPCDKALVTKYFDQIGSKFKVTSGTIWNKEEENGLSVFDLKTHIEPQFVCDFIKAIYDCKLELNQQNGIPLYELATFLLCDKLIEPVREYIVANVDNETLIDTWAVVEPDDLFQGPCIDFMNSAEFDFEKLLKDVGKLTIDKFTAFLNKACARLAVSVLIDLRRSWLKANPGKEYVEKLVFAADFEGISIQKKLEFYEEVIEDMDGELSKRVFKFMFPAGSIVLNGIKSEHEIQKMKHDLENPCNEFVEGNKEIRINYNWNFDDKSAWNSDGCGHLYFFTGAVETDVAEYTWKLRVVSLTRTDYYCVGQYISFGVAGEHGGFPYYAWSNDSHDSFACLNEDYLRTYGSLLKTDDIVEIRLNQIKHNLEFFKNGVSQGIAHEKLPVQRYKLVVNIGGKNIKVTIIDK